MNRKIPPSRCKTAGMSVVRALPLLRVPPPLPVLPPVCVLPPPAYRLARVRAALRLVRPVILGSWWWSLSLSSLTVVPFSLLSCCRCSRPRRWCCPPPHHGLFSLASSSLPWVSSGYRPLASSSCRLPWFCRWSPFLVLVALPSLCLGPLPGWCLVLVIPSPHVSSRVVAVVLRRGGPCRPLLVVPLLVLVPVPVLVLVVAPSSSSSLSACPRRVMGACRVVLRWRPPPGSGLRPGLHRCRCRCHCLLLPLFLILVCCRVVVPFLSSLSGSSSWAVCRGGVVSGGVVEGWWLVVTWCRWRCSPLQSAGVLVFTVSFAIAVLCVHHS